MARENFISTAALAARLGAASLGVIDASWHLPTSGRSGAAEFSLGHIPGAVFFDIDAIADLSTGLPHMLPDAPTFAAAMTTLGLGDGMRFVVYDSLGLFASGASVVDAARFRRHGRAHPRWRPAAMAERGSSDRAGRSATAAAPLHAEARSLLRRGARRRAPGAGDPLGASRRCAAGRPFRGARARAAPGRSLGPHSREPQLALGRLRRERAAAARAGARGRLCRPWRRISAGRSSPPAARASPRRCWRWRSKRRAGGSPGSMTAPGPNGGRAPIARSKPGRRGRQRPESQSQGPED